MAKGLPQHTGDPNVEIGEYTNIPDKRYDVNGIAEFLPNCIDAQGNPIFTDVGGSLKVSLKLRTPSGEEGPAFSATPAEFIALVQWFGGDWFSGDLVPTAKNRTTSAILLLGQKLANTAAKVRNVESKNGWCNRIRELAPPEGLYTVRFVDAHRTDHDPGNYDFSDIQGRNGTFQSLIFEFEIVGDGQGSPSIWDGFPISQFFNNEFVTDYTDSNGNLVTVQEKGIPFYRRHEKSGGTTLGARRWDMFAKYFAPSLEEHDWKVDPTESQFGICEVCKPQWVFIHYAKTDQRKVKAYIKKRQRGVGRTFDMMDLPMTNADVVKEEPKPQPAALDGLLDYITQRWPDIKIFEQSPPDSNVVVFTEEGRAWAREYMGGENGPWVRSGLDLNDRRGLHTLSEEQLKALWREFEAQYGELTVEPW